MMYRIDNERTTDFDEAYDILTERYNDDWNFEQFINTEFSSPYSMYQYMTEHTEDYRACDIAERFFDYLVEKMDDGDFDDIKPIEEEEN